MRFHQIIKQQLDEVAMSPSSLRQEAAKIGATAGMEFEMIVPNVSIEGDSEMDMDADERTNSFDDIYDFFNNGDMNSRRDVQKLIDYLKEGYYDWANEKRWEQWAGEKYDFFRDYFELNDFDEDDAKERATEEIKEANPELPEDSEDFQKLVSSRVEEILDEELDNEWDRQGRSYDNAHEAWEDEAEWPDESDYLHREGWRWMSDLPYNDYDLYWPFMTNGDSDNDATEAAESFSDAVGRHVNVSGSYHGVRKEGEYTVEPDGSLEADDSDDAGLEFVSPPLPLDQMLSDLNKIVVWAKQYGCYTNQSTGLHMNVSVPNFSRENLDYVKLAILLGDQYVLQQFGRLSNTYTKSALGKVKAIIQNKPEQTQAALQQMKNSLGSEAARVIHSGTTDKYTSINTKDGYIEFRSPGGDWLNANFEKLEATLLRFVVALDAACDPQKYRQEYLKKLYKLLEPTTDEYGNMVQQFASYMAGVGGVSPTTVKDFRRAALGNLQQANLAKKTGQQPAPSQKPNYYIKNVQTGEIIHRYYAANNDDAFRELQFWKEQNPGVQLQYGKDIQQ
jgi:hypothetical protein